MSVTNCHVPNSGSDGVTGTYPDTSATVLIAMSNIAVGEYLTAVIDIDTSPIGTDAISAATLYWYHVSYTKTPKAETYQRLISVGSSTILDSTATPPAAGWHSHALEAGELASINKTGNTRVWLQVGDPTIQQRNWQIRAWDYSPTGTFSCYLEVTHAAAGGPTTVSILGV